MFSCERHRADPFYRYQAVVNAFRHDANKLAAAKYLINNIPFHYTIERKFLDKTHVDLSSFIWSYDGPLSMVQLLDSLGVAVREDTIWDRDQVTPGKLIDIVNNAFVNFNSNNVPSKRVFGNLCEFMLPYRVADEHLDLSRDSIRKIYLEKLTHRIRDSNSVSKALGAFYCDVFKDVKHCSRDLRTQRSYNLTEILDTQRWWTCYDLVCGATLLFRALGFPAAYEIIPFYGKFNAGHSVLAVAISGDSLVPLFGSAATYRNLVPKMFRKTFSKQTNFAKEIESLGEKKDDVPQIFNDDFLIDITAERTSVDDIILHVNPPYKHPVFYICVYSDGQWQPVWWGKVDQANKSVRFRDMGRNVLYQTAYMESGQLHFIENPFILDSTSHITYLDTGGFTDVVVTNTSCRPDIIKKGRTYTLSYWNTKTSRWMPHSTVSEKHLRLKFQHVPANAIYKLLSIDIDNRYRRPFIYTKQGAQWW
jgi:hypothetical protein